MHKKGIGAWVCGRKKEVKGTMASTEQRIEVHTLSKKTEDRETCAVAHSTPFAHFFDNKNSSSIGESVQSFERPKHNLQFELQSFIKCKRSKFTFEETKIEHFKDQSSGRIQWKIP